MKKTVTLILALGFLVLGTGTVNANPVRPSGVHPQAKYMEYRGMDCWKYWKVLTCRPK